MIPEKFLKISFTERSLRGKKIILQQSEITYAQALQQVQRVKEISSNKPQSKKTTITNFSLEEIEALRNPK